MGACQDQSLKADMAASVCDFGVTFSGASTPGEIMNFSFSNCLWPPCRGAVRGRSHRHSSICKFEMLFNEPVSSLVRRTRRVLELFLASSFHRGHHRKLLLLWFVNGEL